MSNRTRAPIPRPRPRPERIQGQGQEEEGALMSSPRPVTRPEGLGGDRPAGMYSELGVVDETAQFGALGRRARRNDPEEIVLHQTDTDTADQVRDAYASRVRQGGSIGAHYLIDTDGTTSLTVPTDRAPSHVVGHNQDAIGIENVGRATRIDKRGDIRAQVEAMDIAPPIRERLLAMDDRQLKATVRDNGWALYGDVSGPQKRANWNPLGALTDDHGLDMQDDVHSHEHLQAKTLGEGENIEVMVDAMSAWPAKIARLRAAVEAREASGDVDGLDELRAELQRQEAAQAATDVDGTQAERNAVNAEAMLEEPGGPATEREQTRTAFWDDFYGHMSRLDAALATAERSGPR
jgi:hypothetical protein